MDDEKLLDLAKQFMTKTRYDARYNISYELRNGRVYFHDNRFPHMKEIGALWYIDKFVVESRLITNSKYLSWKRQYHQRECVKPERALKNLIDYVRPLSLVEVGGDTLGKAKDHEHNWKASTKGKANGIIRDRLTISKIVEEIEHLVSMGVEFKTDEFRSIVSEGLDLYKEARRVADVKMAHHYVYFSEGRVYVGNNLREPDGATKEFMPDEPLPEEISNNLALLKMLGDKEFIPEVGFKRSDKEYVVFTPKVDTPQN